MKRIKKLLLLILFIIPISVFAESKCSINAPAMASPGTEISIDIVTDNTVAIDNFKATLTYETSVFELLNIESKNGWIDNTELNKNSPITLDFAHNNGIKGQTTVATIRFRVKDSVSKSDTMITLEASTRNKDDETINTIDKISKTIAIKSTDNTLKSLKMNGELLTNFSPKNYTYSPVVDAGVTTVTFEAELNDKTAKFKEKYEPKKNASLDYGDNVFEIVVISAAGEEKKYVVTVKREDNRGSNNNLKHLIINSNPKLLSDFNENTLEYQVTTHKLETIDISAEAEDPKATVEIKKPEKLEIGMNEVKVIVTSEKKEQRTYLIRVNNLDAEIDTKLKNIELFGCDESIKFDRNVYDYEVTYKTKYNEELVIKPVLNNSDDAEYSIDKELSNLKPGDKVTITVSAKDGTKNVESYYTITFKKDNRINFFLILGLTIFIVLLVIFIKLVLDNKKEKQKIEEKEKEIEKTKRLEKINLE